MCNMAKRYDLLIRLLLLGDSGVGKTCMIYRFADESYLNGKQTTIGIDFLMKRVEIDGKKVRLQLWDTAGQERFETLTTQYYRRAEGIFLVYDITNENTFRNLGKWMDYIRANASDDVELMLLGNKSDIEDERKVTFQQGAKLAKELRIPFYETSAKESDNVQKAFMELVTQVARRHKKEFDAIQLDGEDSDSDSEYISELLQEEDQECKKSECCVIT